MQKVLLGRYFLFSVHVLLIEVRWLFSGIRLACKNPERDPVIVLLGLLHPTDSGRRDGEPGWR